MTLIIIIIIIIIIAAVQTEMHDLSVIPHRRPMF